MQSNYMLSHLIRGLSETWHLPFRITDILMKVYAFPGAKKCLGKVAQYADLTIIVSTWINMLCGH